MFARRLYKKILNISRLAVFLLSILCIASHQVQAQEKSEDRPPLNPILKYPDLSGRNIGMQPVIDDETPTGEMNSAAPAAPSTVTAPTRPKMPAVPSAPVTKIKPSQIEQTEKQTDKTLRNKSVPSPAPLLPSAHIIRFTNGKSDLTSYEITRLEKEIIPLLRKNTEADISLQSYASGGEENSISHAKRMALSRALVLREYLLSRNIASSRIDLDVHHAKDDGPDANRIELHLR